MESNENSKTASQQPVIYRAVGWMTGTYQPSEDNLHQGVFVTEEGLTIPARLIWRLRQYLKSKHPEYSTRPEFFLEPHQWTVYPQTDPLRLQLAVIRPLHSPSSDNLEEEASLGNKRPLNQFKIVGKIKSCSDGAVTVRIRRNERPPKGFKNNFDYQPFTLTLEGSLTAEALGQIWELEVRRSGQNLVILAGRPYEPSAEDLAWIQKQQALDALIAQRKPIKFSDRAEATSVAPSPLPAVEPTPLVDATDTPPATKAAIPVAETSVATDYPAAPPTVATSPTTGKLEVVVKINQFPFDVKTVDSGWKEFSVDTGKCTVTITVKPKAFAALEQAQHTCPLWIAAISGQMGAATVNGFRLESPALKVFERKPLDSEQPEQTTSLKSSLQGPTPGKMELIIKINEFPASVRTVENGCRWFDVHSGDQLVTITVKPKVFKKLVFAQSNYPQWVAAIAGLRGETTERGFVLLEPNIQVFERKPKDSATAEPTTTKDNSEPSPATESQQSPPETTLKTTQEQQPVANPLAKSQPQASPTANSMQRPKEHLNQQRPTKKPKNLGQNQQREQASAGQKQPTASAPKIAPKSGSPRFSVKVNDQVIQGYDSVTLNKRVVRVDGVTVGQAKMVIVLGQPRTIQADGGVSQGRNQAVLTSR